jgi:Zn-finger nucleic acid-binding protein
MIALLGIGPCETKFMLWEAIMEVEKTEVLQLELKYCERCGGLWLRIRGRQEAYCSSCAGAMSEVAIGRKLKRPPRLPVRDIDGQRSSVYPVFLKGGRA